MHSFGTSIRRERRWFVQRTILRNRFLFVWKNVTYLRWLLLHFLLLPLRLCQDALTFGVPCWSTGLLEALFKLPQVLIRRAREQREETFSVAQIGRLLPSPLEVV